jgi:beta-galactosidase
LGRKTWPKIGNVLYFQPQYNRVEWFGRGPEESYPDRWKGIWKGVYSGTVQQQYEPYIVPQENGNKSGVEWFELTNPDGEGIRIEGEALNISVYDYDLSAFDKATHYYQVQPTDSITLNIDYKQAGLGGDNSLSRSTHKPYILKKRKYTYGYRIKLVDKGQ